MTKVFVQCMVVHDNVICAEKIILESVHTSGDSAFPVCISFLIIYCKCEYIDSYRVQ